MGGLSEVWGEVYYYWEGEFIVGKAHRQKFLISSALL